MSPQLLEIQPRELEFKFELKKENSCSVHLMNNSDHLVAFKVKTTSPKRYSVQPSIGIVEPKSTCVLTVVMHAPLVPPPNMQSKDKFLIQSIVIPEGTTETDIKPNMFTKDSGRQIEESKLRVVFMSPFPTNDGPQKQELTHQVADSQDNVGKDLEQLKPSKDAQKVSFDKDVEELKLANKGIEELNLKFAELQLKLRETEVTIARLRGDRNTALADSQKLKQKLAMLKRENGLREVNVGFPFLFVCLVALVGMALGYLLHSRETYLL